MVNDRVVVEVELLGSLVAALRGVEAPIRRNLAEGIEHLAMPDIARMKGQLEAYAGIRTQLEQRRTLLDPPAEPAPPRPGLFDNGDDRPAEPG